MRAVAVWVDGKILADIAKFIFCLAIVVSASLLGPASAQSPGAAPSPASSDVTLPDPLTEQSLRALISELDDKQVRSLLIKRLSADAERRTQALAEHNRRSLFGQITDLASDLSIFFYDAWSKLPGIPAAISRTFERFAQARGARPWGAFVASLVASLGTGVVVGLFMLWGLNALGRTRAVAHSDRPAEDFWTRMSLAGARLGRWLLAVGAFAITARLINAWWNGDGPADETTVRWVIAMCGWTAVAAALVAFMFSPSRADLRLCEADDEAARFLTVRIAIAAAIFNVGLGFASWLNEFGSPYSETWFGFWVNAALHTFLALTFWQARRALTEMVVGSDPITLQSPSLVARIWPYFIIVLIALHWLTVELLVATSEVPQGLFRSMAITLVLIVALPVMSHGVRALIENLFPDNGEKAPALRAADRETARGATRIARVALAALLIIGLMKMWGVDFQTLAARSVGAALARDVVRSFLIIGLGYGLWELIRIVTDRQIAAEKVALGLDHGDGDFDHEGEGGGAGARLGTLLPLVRVGAGITIAVLSTLAVLGELGVNVLPLLAGAGVVGLAIGFGAQTLVKDIISGIFFLVDDAFRKGEYIDIGSVKGTVEKISLRSMQLRHHNGPLNTVPFGDIRHVTNFSRDWVVMKFSVRLTFDTDAEKVRKLIKKLGQELLEDPENGPKFLQPLKSQGVIELDDSAQIMRIKFMTRPGEQWGLRRLVLARLRDLFEKNHIRFASREVVVRVDGPGAGASQLDPAALGAAATSAGRLATGSGDRGDQR